MSPEADLGMDPGAGPRLNLGNKPRGVSGSGPEAGLGQGESGMDPEALPVPNNDLPKRQTRGKKVRKAEKQQALQSELCQVPNPPVLNSPNRVLNFPTGTLLGATHVRIILWVAHSDQHTKKSATTSQFDLEAMRRFCARAVYNLQIGVP